MISRASLMRYLVTGFDYGIIQKTGKRISSGNALKELEAVVKAPDAQVIFASYWRVKRRKIRDIRIRSLSDY